MSSRLEPFHISLFIKISIDISIGICINMYTYVLCVYMCMSSFV